MNNFKKQFKQGDDYCDIRADYRSLISIGKSVEETEDLLLRAYCPKDGDLLFTPTFWLSLGICEWETGRLTPRTKEEALYCLSLYQETVEQRLAAGPNERLSDMLQFFRDSDHRSHAEAVAGMNAHWVNVFNKAYGNHISFCIADNFQLQLFPSKNGLFYQNLTHEARLQTSCADCL